MSAGKGDRRRPGSQRVYGENFERIWGKREKLTEEPKPANDSHDDEKQKYHENENDHADG